MNAYRAYIIGRDGHIQKRFELTATDETTARKQAMRLVDGHDVELWQGSTRIETFSHKQ